MSQQLLFCSADQSQQTLENYYPANNANVISALADFAHCENGFNCLYIYGPSGSGKTHLLRSSVNMAKADVTFIDLESHSEHLYELVNKDDLSHLILDNFDTISAHQSTMMLIYETLKLKSGKLLIASKSAPKALDLDLADLTSRLMSSQLFELKLLHDEDKINALKFRAKLRGFELSQEVVKYIISRYPRDFKTLFGLLDKIDNASLQSQRKITIPFIKEIEQ